MFTIAEPRGRRVFYSDWIAVQTRLYHRPATVPMKRVIEQLHSRDSLRQRYTGSSWKHGSMAGAMAQSRWSRKGVKRRGADG